MDNLRAAEELLDDGRAESHVSPKAKHAGDLIGIGVYPRLGNMQELRNRVGFEEAIKAAAASRMSARPAAVPWRKLLAWPVWRRRSGRPSKPVTFQRAQRACVPWPAPLSAVTKR